jgi:preprotein translocase subunit Sec63
MSDPFSTLGVGEDADDDQIKQRYLSLVRLFPPDREPERFQAYRAAYESLSDERKRLEAKLLSTRDTALAHIKSHLLAPSKPLCARASKSTITALLIDGIDRACGQDCIS